MAALDRAGVIAVGAVGAHRVHDRRRGTACVGAPCVRRSTGRTRRRRARGGTGRARGPRRGPMVPPRPGGGRRRVAPRTESRPRPVRRSTGARPSISPPNRSPPDRSAGSSWPVRMTGRHHASSWSTSPAAARGRSDRSETSSAARRRPVRDGHLRDARRSRHPSGPRHLAPAGRSERRPRSASSSRSLTTRGSVGPSRPNSPGTSTATAWRSSPAASSPAARRLLEPVSGTTAAARRPGPRSPRRGRWRLGRDLRRLPRAPLPDRLDRRRDG